MNSLFLSDNDIQTKHSKQRRADTALTSAVILSESHCKSLCVMIRFANTEDKPINLYHLYNAISAVSCKAASFMYSFRFIFLLI